MTDTTQKGSDTWAKSIRRKAKELAHTVTLNYVDLATTLWEINSTPIDGDPSNPPIFHKWSYNKFTTFAKEELGLEPRKAAYLERIGYMINVELANADPEWKERFLLLGWTKVREISRVLKASQLQDWVLQAEQANFQEIENMVAVYKANEEKAIQERELLAKGYSISRDPFAPPKNEETPTPIGEEGVDVNVQVSGAEFTTDLAVQAPVSVPKAQPERISAPVIEVPSPEKITQESFALFDDQLKYVKQALEKAGEISKSGKKGHNLTLICMEFLATNNFSNETEEQRLKFLAKLEKILGYKLIAADPDDYSISYGLENLQKVAQQQIIKQKEEVIVCSR